VSIAVAGYEPETRQNYLRLYQYEYTVDYATATARSYLLLQNVLFLSLPNRSLFL